jgi:hypothetical protein
MTEFIERNACRELLESAYEMEAAPSAQLNSVIFPNAVNLERICCSVKELKFEMKSVSGIEKRSFGYTNQ